MPNRIKTWVIRILPLFTFFAAFLLFAHWAKQNSANRDDAKLKELEQIAVSVPRFPQFRDIASDTSSASDDAGVYKYYSSAASYDEVKSFYFAELTQKGWSIVNEEPLYDWFRDYGGRSLEFRKQEFLIAIEYTGKKPDAESWNYAVSFVWRDKY